MKILLILSGIFYSILCVFSIVTGLIYMSGKRKLNPLELSDNFVKKLDTEEKLNNFTRKMGLVTFIVGIVQGITAYSIFVGNNIFFYCISIGFTIFSICSVLFKLKGKINAFPIIKLVFYILILVVLILSLNKRNEIPQDYLFVFNGGSGEVTYSTYIYKIDNGHSNYGFKYINTTNTTKSYGSSEIVQKITKIGNLMWTDEVFTVAKENNAYSYVLVRGKKYTPEEFAPMFLMD